jgi:glucokinase
MKQNLIGIDIGGTKCAVIYGIQDNGNLTIVDKQKFPTTSVNETIHTILEETDRMMSIHQLSQSNTEAIGISCGGPLDSKEGIVMSPPNLPNWDNIPIVSILEKATGLKAGLQNDANACALAEWKFGSGQGTQNMVFLTFGTGLGAGIILNGKLYSGTNDNAGELGHIRLSDYGPIGYGKMGSFEGFASGSGIAQLAQSFIMEKFQRGEQVSWCKPEDLDKLNAQIIAQEAQNGDPLAQNVYETSATYLGKGLAILIDLLNPEVIVVGGIYTRNEKLMRPIMQKIIEKEALSCSNKVCRIVPAALGEHIGDYAALSIAANLIGQPNK